MLLGWQEMIVKDMNRAIRRHHAARLKKARRFYFGQDNSLDAARLGKVLNTPTPCSCPMCCNWRKIGGPTLAELVHRLELKEE